MDVQLSKDSVTFGDSITIRHGNVISIPESGIVDLRAQIFMDECSFQLSIAPRVIRKDTKYVIITGTGIDLEEQRRDFIDSFKPLKN